MLHVLWEELCIPLISLELNWSCGCSAICMIDSITKEAILMLQHRFERNCRAQSVGGSKQASAMLQNSSEPQSKLYGDTVQKCAH